MKELGTYKIALGMQNL